MTELKIENTKQGQKAGSVKLEVKDPPDFSEGGSEHRKGVIGNTSLIIVLISAIELNPTLLGIKVSVPVLWFLIGVSHVYFFSMWRLTSPIESDTENKFWNIRGLYKQAFMKGTEGFPGKTKGRIFFIRALPIWAFVIGFFGVVYGLCLYFGI